MREQKTPQIYYESDNSDATAQQIRIDRAFDLVFDEVLRRRSNVRRYFASSDSTHAGRQQ